MRALPLLPVLRLLYPSACLLCRRQLLDPEDVQVCRSCGEGIEITRPPFCGRCGEPFAQPFEESAEPDMHLCTPCRGPRPFAFARSLSVYDGHFRDIIHLYKYRKRPQLATYLSWKMFEYALMHPVLWESDSLVPIPLHRRRLRNRGYDQAKLLARRLAPLMNLPCLEALSRVRHTPPQTTLPRNQRTRSLRGAFEVTADVAGRNLLLIDDVYTTGSTAAEAANTLQSAGAGSISVFTAARTLQNPT